jgi:GH25 family lysozyme M1 (1,4-beta-N-acetylmuramidase)
MIPGVDRSHHNSPYPMATLVAKGNKFVWLKVAQWTTGEDKTFNASWQEAKNTVGLLRGGYYFLDPRFDGIEQCKQFLSFGINFTAAGCIGGCVDVEDLVVFDANGINKALTAQANKWVADNWQLALRRLWDFLNYFKEQTGLNCIIYSYNNYMREYYHSTPFPNNPMWLSSLQATCPPRYDTGKLPEFWQLTYNWQNSDMDGDFYTGTQEQLNTLANIV